MFTKAIITAAVFSMATIALSSPSQVIQTLKKNGAEIKVRATLPSMVEMTDQCVNFAGKWAGECIDQNGHIEQMTREFKQESCYAIEDESLEFPIGGTLLLSNTPNPNDDSFDSIGYTGIIAHRWNDSQTTLQSLLTVNLFGGYGVIQTSKMWMQGDKLRTKDTDSKALMIDSSTPYIFTNDDCTYSKVP